MDTKQLLSQLNASLGKFDEENCSLRMAALRQLNEVKWPFTNLLKELHDVLLFISAYSANEKEHALASAVLSRMTLWLALRTEQQKTKFSASGLPFTSITTSFSYDLLKWSEETMPGNFSYDSLDNEEALPALLKNTLPDALKEILTEEKMNSGKILRTVFGKKKNYLPGILHEVSKLNAVPGLRDQLFDALGMNCTFRPNDKAASLAFNRFEPAKIFHHTDLLKKIDHAEWINKKLPAPRKLDEAQRKQLKNIIRMSLLLLGRETEPSTWMDDHSIRIFDLERGISVCIYGMTKDHRQPLESYFGFTAFKNGYPMSYGGAWLFGKRALFGMNIFEWFRGGESALVFAQLLRTYRQFFGIDYFEVEPYQYGKDNPEGIKSGAFWFYYRFGFRLLDKKLHELSEAEARRIAAEKGYRTPVSTLRNFVHSNIGLQLGNKEIPVAPAVIRSRIVAVISEQFSGNSILAEREIVRSFQKLTGIKTISGQEKKVLTDLAWFVMSGTDQAHYAKKKKELKQLISLKNSDEIAYQQLLKKVLK